MLYTYNNIGHFKEITDHKGNSLYKTEKKSPLGQIERFRLGGIIAGSMEYHTEKQTITRIHTAKGENILQDLSYEYDGFSNLASRTDNKRNLEERTPCHLLSFSKLRMQLQELPIKLPDALQGTARPDKA